MEVKGYVERFLEMQGLVLHDYKQQYSNSTLNLYISYSILPEFIFGKKSKTEKLVLTNNLGDSKAVKKDKFLPLSFTQNSHASLFKVKTPIDYYKMKKYLTKHSQEDQSLMIKSKVSELSSDSLGAQKVSGVLSNFFKVLSLFTNNRFNIIVNFCCLNKNLSFLKKTQEKNFILLQKFKGTPFLKEGIELLFYSLYARNSATLLAKFIAMQMKTVKRHKFFCLS